VVPIKQVGVLESQCQARVTGILVDSVIEIAGVSGQRNKGLDDFAVAYANLGVERIAFRTLLDVDRKALRGVLVREAELTLQ
jgi:hypothetical protein